LFRYQHKTALNNEDKRILYAFLGEITWVELLKRTRGLRSVKYFQGK